MASKKFRRRVLPITMAGIMVASCMPAMAATPSNDWTMDDAIKSKQELTVKIDGVEKKMALYTDYYLDKDGSLNAKDYENAKVNIYVPDNATADSPIIYAVDNSGWRSDSYYTFESGKDAVTADMVTANDATGKTAFVAKALEKGYVVVTAGLRARGTTDKDGNYVHSPITVADAKAVIRYLQYNDEVGLLPAGDPDKIVITGHSGGGGLSVAIGASGNSADYYPELFKMGAVGITQTSGGDYTSTLEDDVLAVVAYSPITDLGNADGAYEYTYAQTRQTLLALADENAVNSNANAQNVLSDKTMELSPLLANVWVEYAAGLKLVDENGAYLTYSFTTGENGEKHQAGGSFYQAIENLIIAGMNKGLADVGYEQFVKDMESQGFVAEGSGFLSPQGYNDLGIYEEELGETWKVDWITFNAEKTEVVDIELEDYLLYVAAGTVLKNAPSFDNQGTTNTGMNENNLWGYGDEEYSHVSEYAYGIEAEGTYFATKYAGVDWEEFWAENGDTLQEQKDMVNSISYLTSEDGDSAPYWYVRHGIIDRDQSFANQTLLYYAMMNDKTIDQEYMNFAFGWFYGHKGWMDVSEASAWVDTVLADVAADTTVTPPTTDSTTPSTDNNGTATNTSPKTGDVTTLPLLAVVAAVAAVAVAGTRKRVIH